MEIVLKHTGRAIMGRGSLQNGSCKTFVDGVGQINTNKIVNQHRANAKSSVSHKAAADRVKAVVKPFMDVTNRQRTSDVIKNKPTVKAVKIKPTVKAVEKNKSTDKAVDKNTLMKKKEVVSKGLSNKQSRKLRVSETAFKKFVEDEAPNGVTNIDSRDDEGFGNPRYATDIVNYTRNLELKYQLKGYLDSSDNEIHSRAILIDWLIQVQTYLKLQQQTLHLTVAIIDKVLSLKSIPLSKLQLLGITCLLVATKYEQLFAPRIQKLLHLTEDSYTYRQVVQMEQLILNTLEFTLCVPTPMLFMDRGFKAVHSDTKLELLTRFILDLSLTDFSMLKFAPSLRATSAIYVAKRILDTEKARKDTSWFRPLCYYLGYTHVNLRECVQALVGILSRSKSSKFQAAREKYSHKLYEGVGQWTCIENYVERKSTC